MGSISPADAVIPVSWTAEPRDQKGAAKAGDFHLHKKGITGLEAGGDHQIDEERRRMRGACIGRLRVMDIILRSAVLAFTVVSLCAMFTSTQYSEVRILGFSLAVSMRWNRSQPFLFLVVADLLICMYALAQFIYQSVVFVKKVSLTRRRVWMQLAADQVFVYLVIAAAAAAAGASRTNKSAFRTLGVQNMHVSGVCTVLDKFCNRATIAVIFTSLAAGASAIIAALDLYLLMLGC